MEPNTKNKRNPRATSSRVAAPDATTTEDPQYDLDCTTAQWEPPDPDNYSGVWASDD